MTSSRAGWFRIGDVRRAEPNGGTPEDALERALRAGQLDDFTLAAGRGEIRVAEGVVAQFVNPRSKSAGSSLASRGVLAGDEKCGGDLQRLQRVENGWCELFTRPVVERERDQFRVIAAAPDDVAGRQLRIPPRCRGRSRMSSGASSPPTFGSDSMERISAFSIKLHFVGKTDLFQPAEMLRREEGLLPEDRPEAGIPAAQHPERGALDIGLLRQRPLIKGVDGIEEPDRVVGIRSS